MQRDELVKIQALVESAEPAIEQLRAEGFNSLATWLEETSGRVRAILLSKNQPSLEDFRV